MYRERCSCGANDCPRCHPHSYQDDEISQAADEILAASFLACADAHETHGDFAELVGDCFGDEAFGTKATAMLAAGIRSDQVKAQAIRAELETMLRAEWNKQNTGRAYEEAAGERRMAA